MSSLTVPSRVIRFLITPFNSGFDPTLVFLALGALPVATVSYFYGRGEEKPRLGGKWTIPEGGEIDWRLLVGAAIFGIGWGIEGICRTSATFSVPSGACLSISACSWTYSREPRNRCHSERSNTLAVGRLVGFVRCRRGIGRYYSALINPFG